MRVNNRKRRRIDYTELEKLADQGMGIVEISEQMGFTKGAISKAVKKLNIAVTKTVATQAVPEIVGKKTDAMTHLLTLVEKAKTELDWIEESVPPVASAGYQTWQDQKLKFASEMRKTISAIADIGYKIRAAGFHHFTGDTSFKGNVSFAGFLVTWI